MNLVMSLMTLLCASAASIWNSFADLVLLLMHEAYYNPNSFWEPYIDLLPQTFEGAAHVTVMLDDVCELVYVYTHHALSWAYGLVLRLLRVEVLRVISYWHIVFAGHPSWASNSDRQLMSGLTSYKAGKFTQVSPCRLLLFGLCLCI